MSGPLVPLTAVAVATGLAHGRGLGRVAAPESVSEALLAVVLGAAVVSGLLASRRPEPGPQIHDRQLDWILAAALLGTALALRLVAIDPAVVPVTARLDLLALPVFAAGIVVVVTGTRQLCRWCPTLVGLELGWLVVLSGAWLPVAHALSDPARGLATALLAVPVGPAELAPVQGPLLVGAAVLAAAALAPGLVYSSRLRCSLVLAAAALATGLEFARLLLAGLLRGVGAHSTVAGTGSAGVQLALAMVAVATPALLFTRRTPAAPSVRRTLAPRTSPVIGLRLALVVAFLVAAACAMLDVRTPHPAPGPISVAAGEQAER